MLNKQLNTRLYRSLITKDLQKKPHHYIKTGRKHGGRQGLARLTQAAAEVPEGYFSGQGWVPLRSVRSKHQAGPPSLEHQHQERNPNNIRL